MAGAYAGRLQSVAGHLSLQVGRRERPGRELNRGGRLRTFGLQAPLAAGTNVVGRDAPRPGWHAKN